MSAPSFTINRFDNIIAVRLTGDWNQAIDLRYLSELGVVMQRMRQSTWGVLVDFRQWTVGPAVIAQNVNYSLHFDRRNQTSECWLVNDDAQARHLEFFFKDLPFSPHRVKTQQDALTWARDNNFPKSTALTSWLSVNE
ncbi:hypothetical protein [Alteromonas oceanisediminis]|uniref:hypothetical protein n=1 Tax=Alteromonas oceanisediminis TaxID=2836180 RepID=UPI001BDAA217|nr:hypothetical protein [Alteromonas oceanisediminis]MBT0586277.1 hypothetical protein [Alteromonas oceanisediminis]